MRGFKPVTLIIATITFVAFGTIVSMSGCDNQSTSQSPSPAGKPQPTPAPAEQPAPKPATQAAVPQVVIETAFGNIVVELDPVRAPKTVANFLKYVDDHFYDGLLFHRVIKNFMIQAGWVNANLQMKDPTYPTVVNESQNTAPNTIGTIAMARTSDPNSASSQFFINTADNRSLNFGGPYGGYTVFGRVIQGMDVVEKIASVSVKQSNISEAQPLENVVITTIRRK